jgi:hypothetical protein
MRALPFGLGSRPAAHLRRAAVAGIGAAVVLGIVFAAGVQGSAPTHGAVAPPSSVAMTPTPNAAPAAPAPPPAAPAVPPPAPAPAGSARVEIHASPAWAHLKIDGRPVSNPFAGEVARDGSHHVVTAEAPGYFPQVDAFDANGDVVRALALHGRPHAPGASNDSAPPSAGPAPPAEPAAIVTVRPIDPSNPYAH